MLLSPIISILPLCPAEPAAPACDRPISLLLPVTSIAPRAPNNEVVVLVNTIVLLSPVTSTVLVLLPIVSKVIVFMPPVALARIVESPQPPVLRPADPQWIVMSFKLPSATLVTLVGFPLVWTSNVPVFIAPICCMSTVRLPPPNIDLDEVVPMTLPEPCCKMPIVEPSPTCSI